MLSRPGLVSSLGQRLAASNLGWWACTDISVLPQDAPTCKLLYVTPEQLVRNGTLHELLAGLHRRGRLARLVVDEVPSAVRLHAAIGAVPPAHAARLRSAARVTKEPVVYVGRNCGHAGR